MRRQFQSCAMFHVSQIKMKTLYGYVPYLKYHHDVARAYWGRYCFKIKYWVVDILVRHIPRISLFHHINYIDFVYHLYINVTYQLMAMIYIARAFLP